MKNHGPVSFFNKKNGNVMVMSVGVILIILMFVAVVIDMGRYYTEVKFIERVISMPSERVDQLLNYYIYINDLDEKFDEVVETCLIESHRDPNNAKGKAVKISSATGPTDFYVTSIETTVKYEGEYRCLFLSVLGFDTLPVNVSVERISSIPVDKVYHEGDPYSDYEPPESTQVGTVPDPEATVPGTP